MKMDNMRWLLVGALALIVFGIFGNGAGEKNAIADIQGKSCAEDTDCPCIGFPAKYNYSSPGAEGYGLGVGTCSSGTCDMTWCYDVAGWGDWVRDNPWQWLKDHTAVTLGIVALGLLLIFWPK